MLSAVGLILALKACHMLQGSMLLAHILLALSFISVFNLSNSTSHALRIPSLTLDQWGMSIPGTVECVSFGHPFTFMTDTDAIFQFNPNFLLVYM